MKTLSVYQEEFSSEEEFNEWVSHFMLNSFEFQNANNYRFCYLSDNLDERQTAIDSYIAKQKKKELKHGLDLVKVISGRSALVGWDYNY